MAARDAKWREWMRRLRSDHVGGAGLVALGAAVFLGGWHMPLGTLSFPGPAFMPFLLAGLIALSGLALMLSARSSRRVAEIDWSDWRFMATVFAIMGFGVLLFRPLGFVISVSLVVFSLVRLVEGKSTATALLFTAVVMAGSYVLLVVIFGTPLPRGPLGF